MDNLLLQAQEEAWSKEEVEIIVSVQGDLGESARRIEEKRRQRHPGLRGAGAVAIGILAGGLLILILRLWGPA